MLSGNKPEAPRCPQIDAEQCVDPCMVFWNRHGCEECVCPAAPTESEQNEDREDLEKSSRTPSNNDNAATVVPDQSGASVGPPGSHRPKQCKQSLPRI